MSDISLAIEMLEQGRREDAVRELERILAEDIDQIAAWRLLALAVDNPVEIQECYEHVLRLDPHDLEAIEALRKFSPQESIGDGTPFLQDDLSELDQHWDNLDEPPVKKGIDTAPLNLVDSSPAAYPENPIEQPSEPGQSAEALLFDEEDHRTAAPQANKGGFLENDAFFYTLVVIVIIAVLAILYYIFRGSLLPWLQNLIPG